MPQTSIFAPRIPEPPLEVVILALPKAGLLDLFGPAEVFNKANLATGKSHYRVRLVSTQEADPNPFHDVLNVTATFVETPECIDTLLVAGGPSWNLSAGSAGDRALVAWLNQRCTRARRFGSLCSGSTALAEAGLLEKRRATTHWSVTHELAKRYPAVSVFADRLFVKDGNCYTAAGGTSAIDLALLLVEEDLGTTIAIEVAKQMVLFLRRTGEQPQLSSTLLAQRTPNSSINNLLLWMVDHLDQDLSVPQLARRVAMSSRNFARSFLKEVGRTPGKYVADIRLEAARRHLAHKSLGLAEVAKVCGFSSVEVLRRMFIKQFGTSPGRYRLILQ